MRKLSAHTLLLLAAIMIASIAAMPATLARPEAPTARATGNTGEITISWDRIQGAEYYTVGWINWTQGQELSDKGEDWTSLFHYTTVLGSVTSYTVNGLVGGDNHHAIIRATDEADGRFGGGYSDWSDWSPAVQPEPPALPAPAQPEDGVNLTPPTASGDCSAGQRLDPGRACIWSPENMTIFVINGGAYHNWLVFHNPYLIRLHRIPAHEDFSVAQSAIDGQIIEIETQGSVWVIKRVS